MIRSLYTAATGMKANQLYVDNITNNLSNINTVAFKKTKVEFEDLLYQTMVEPGSGNAEGASFPAGIQVGVGVRVVASQKVFSQGNISETSNPLDLSILGDGFFQVAMPSGEIAYTRGGAFKISAEGSLVTSQGYLLEPPIVLPEGSQDITIDESGRVYVSLDGSNISEEIGQIELARFINPSGLKSMGNNVFTMTAASGSPDVDAPGEASMGKIQSGFLESSNVQLVEEMVNMIVAQRAYEVVSKAIQTSEEMLQLANQLRR